MEFIIITENVRKKKSFDNPTWGQPGKEEPVYVSSISAAGGGSGDVTCDFSKGLDKIKTYQQTFDYDTVGQIVFDPN